MGCDEKSLKQHPVVTETCSALPSYSGSGQTHCSSVHKLLFADNIAAGGGKTAAGVLYKRPCHEVNAEIGGFGKSRELPIAVVDHDVYSGINGFYKAAYLPYFLRGK